MDCGRKIADLRKSKKMTQEELGKVLNVTYQAVSKWERGESLPDFEMISRIAKYFQVPIGYFADGEEELSQPADSAAASEYIGMCTQCGRMLKEEDAYSLSPKLICRSCAERLRQTAEVHNNEVKRRADALKQKEIDEQRGHGFDVTLILSLLFSIACYIGLTIICFNAKSDDSGAYGALLFIVPLAVFGSVHALSNFIRDLKYDDFDEDVGYTRNLSLIIGGVFAALNVACFLTLYISSKEIIYIILLVISLILSFTFVSQFMWGGIIQSIFTAGGFTFKLPGFIFSLDIDSILFMIIAKIFLGILAALIFIVTTVVVAIFAILVSAFSFIPSVIAKSVKDTKVSRQP